MQVRNDYDNMVFNGDIGRIVRLDPDSRTVGSVISRQRRGRAVRYGEDALDQLTLAYAVSVHKSQGSEYPCIVMPITWVMPALMSRNLLYTALARAKRLAVLVGEKRALGAYIRNDRAAERLPAFGNVCSRRKRTGGALNATLGKTAPRVPFFFDTFLASEQYH